jgi:hypothetical protein
MRQAQYLSPGTPLVASADAAAVTVLVQVAGGVKGLKELAEENGKTLEDVKRLLEDQGVSTLQLGKQMAALQADVADIKATTRSIDAKADTITQVRV